MRRKDDTGTTHYEVAVEDDLGSFVAASELAAEMNDSSKDRRAHYYPYITKLPEIKE